MRNRGEGGWNMEAERGPGDEVRAVGGGQFIHGLQHMRRSWDSIIKLLRCHLEDCKQGWDGTEGRRRGS